MSTVADVLAGRASWAIEQGDVLARLAELPDGCINCVVTSPPYWGLRDYGVEGQIGLEPTPDAYVARMVAVFREVKRVMRPDAIAWVNLGDSYVNDPGNGRGGENCNGGVPHRSATSKLGLGLKRKDLLGMPWRVAFALQADGWWLRSDVVWAKSNPMPESVTDRPTRAHEYLFLLTKSARYWYDADAIREEGAEPDRQRLDRIGGANGHTVRHSEGGMIGASASRNKRTVWTIATEPYPDAHFATMPSALVEPCILAGCPAQTCPACGAPWERVVERTFLAQPDVSAARVAYRGKGLDASNGWDGVPRGSTRVATLGWSPTCTCDRADTVPGVVLDPFSGAGTVLVEALRHGRRAIGFDLSAVYCEMARKRIIGDCPIFNDPAAAVAPAARPSINKQDGVGKATYTGFNARWAARTRPDADPPPPTTPTLFDHPTEEAAG